MPIMTRLTEVSGTKTEPNCQWATIPTFVLQKVLSMFFFRTGYSFNRTARGTDQILKLQKPINLYFRLELLLNLRIHGSFTVLQAPKIGIFALETHIIGIYRHAIHFLFIVKRRFLFDQFVIVCFFLNYKTTSNYSLLVAITDILSCSTRASSSCIYNYDFWNLNQDLQLGHKQNPKVILG